jgi:hypothetical protein
MKGRSFERFIFLYFPWIIATLFNEDPLLSYLIAWSGSFFIFFITLTGVISPLPADRSFGNQIMRPLILVQIIFAGYMCCTSIFYLLSLYGYDNFHQIPFYAVDSEKLALTAQCQRYYSLGHAAMVSGILLFMRYKAERKYAVDEYKLLVFLFYATMLTLPISGILMSVPGLAQFANQFSSLSFIAAALGLAFSIFNKDAPKIAICFVFYGLNFYSALLSGFKEPIILSVLVLGVFLYPVYRKIVIIVFIPVLVLLFFILPTYVGVIRATSWTGDTDADAASSDAINATLNKQDLADETTWDFLVNRFSEIDMFTAFVANTPAQRPFYGTELIEQSLMAVVPRAFWPSKPSTEEMVMKRVYDAGIVNPLSSVSAKPAFIVDAYLSGGGFGVFLYLFIYGAAAQLISQKAEKLFGGYTLGTALIFSGLFQIFWRGLSFEFMFNTVFWSLVSMYLLFVLVKRIGVIKKV